MKGSNSAESIDAKDTRPPECYAINLAWINQTLDPNQPYIYPCKTEEELVEKFLGAAQKWKNANPDAEVEIWYDSLFVSPDAVRKTQDVLDKNENLKGIKIMDIRNIEVVKNNPDSFSDMVPIYARVDLIKLILCVHSIEEKGNQCAIYSDIDVGNLRDDKGRMSKSELFNYETMKKLKYFGIELGRDAFGKTENQFIQVLNKPETILALKLTIDATLLRIVTTLNSTFILSNNMLKHLNSGTVMIALLNESMNLIYSFISKEEGTKIKINLQAYDLNHEEEWVEYQPLIHGCIPLGNYFLGATDGRYCFLRFDDNKKCVLTLTTKYIKLPEAFSVYKPGRDDMDTRIGSEHPVDFKKLVMREPTNKESFQCEFMPPPRTDLISDFQPRNPRI